jgi:cyclic-di-AMP phosphodiesterase PgpH
MSRLKSFFSSFPYFVQYLFVLGVVCFISFLFPDNLTFKYQFEKGKTWRYEDLVTPFDFAIKKTDAEITAETRQIKNEFSPYYELNTNILRNQKKFFADEFQKQLTLIKQDNQFRDVQERPERYLNYGNDFLDRIYQQGVIQIAPAHQEKSKDFVINLLEGNTTQQQTLEYFFSIESAKALLTDSLPYSTLQEPDFLYPLLESALTFNVFYNPEITNKFLGSALASISTTRGMVRKGDVLVLRGSAINDEIYQKLISLKEQYEQNISSNHSRWVAFSGYFLLTLLIVSIFAVYLSMFAAAVFKKPKELFFILMWLVIYGYLVYAVEKMDTLSAYMIPFCIVPIVINTFYNNQLAFFTHINVVIIASFLSSLGYEFTLLQILAGIVVLLSNIDNRNWSRFFLSMLNIFLTYALAFFALSLIQEGSFYVEDWSIYIAIFVNAFLTMLAYPLIPLLERLFRFVSPITLIELSDMNRPLLRELGIKAAGTLQHSLQVSNMAEAAARKIDADPLLVKTGALYHDIGKMVNPTFFIENQGNRNPHDSKSNLESAKIIIDHVNEGVQLAKKHRLPNVLIDFIRTHHGTTRVEYFYRNYKQEHPTEAIDEALFSYSGPKPRTKEQTILMMADSIEAACRSLKQPTETLINETIEKIIAGKITQGQMQDSRLTFRELELCKKEFKRVMKSVHHSRIEYPEEVKENNATEKQSE